MSWHQVLGPGGPAEITGLILDSLDLGDRGVLGAVARGAPVAPPRPAPEVLSHVRRLGRDVRRLRRELKNYQRRVLLDEMAVNRAGGYNPSDADLIRNLRGSLEDFREAVGYGT